MTAKRKPCPFCGKDKVHNYFQLWPRTGHLVRCWNNRCPVQPTTRLFQTALGAEHAWNRRMTK